MHRLELTFSGSQRLLQVGHALLVCVEAPSLDRKPLDLRAHGLNQLCAVLLHSRCLAGEQIAPHCRGVELVLNLFSELFGVAQYLLRAGDLTVSFLQLSDLRFHRPHHLVEPAGLGRGVIDGHALGFERLHLDGHVLAQRIQRLEPLLGRRRELVERS